MASKRNEPNKTPILLMIFFKKVQKKIFVRVIAPPLKKKSLHFDEVSQLKKKKLGCDCCV